MPANKIFVPSLKFVPALDKLFSALVHCGKEVGKLTALTI